MKKELYNLLEVTLSHTRTKLILMTAFRLGEIVASWNSRRDYVRTSNVAMIHPVDVRKNFF